MNVNSFSDHPLAATIRSAFLFCTQPPNENLLVVYGQRDHAIHPHGTTDRLYLFDVPRPTVHAVLVSVGPISVLNTPVAEDDRPDAVVSQKAAKIAPRGSNQQSPEICQRRSRPGCPPAGGSVSRAGATVVAEEPGCVVSYRGDGWSAGGSRSRNDGTKETAAANPRRQAACAPGSASGKHATSPRLSAVADDSATSAPARATAMPPELRSTGTIPGAPFAAPFSASAVASGPRRPAD